MCASVFCDYCFPSAESISVWSGILSITLLLNIVCPSLLAAGLKFFFNVSDTRLLYLKFLFYIGNVILRKLNNMQEGTDIQMGPKVVRIHENLHIPKHKPHPIYMTKWSKLQTELKYTKTVKIVQFWFIQFV